MMNKIRPHCVTLCLSAFIISALSTPAHAGQIEKNAQACRTAIDENMGMHTGISSELYYKLKKIRGNKVQRMTYRARTEAGKSIIICTVKRAKVVELTDGDKRPRK